MRVEEWMSHPVHTVKPLDTAAHARELLEKYRINQLAVVLKNELVGIVTDRDLRDAFPSVFQLSERSRSNLPDPQKMAVESIMSHRVLTVQVDDTVRDAAEIMRRERVGALPVLRDGRLVGILTRSDILDALISLADSAETD